MSNHSNPVRVDHVLSEACMLQWQQSKPLLHLTHIAQTTMRIGGQLSSVTQRLLGCNTVANGRVAAATAPDVEPPSFVSATLLFHITSKGLCLQNVWATWSLAALSFAAQTDHLIWPQSVLYHNVPRVHHNGLAKMDCAAPPLTATSNKLLHILGSCNQLAKQATNQIKVLCLPSRI